MTKKEIEKLALKYFQGKTSPEEEALLHQWYDEVMEDDARVVVHAEQEGSTEVMTRLLSHLRTEIQTEKRHSKGAFSTRGWLSYAASFLLLLTIGWGIYYFSSDRTPSDIHHTALLEGDVGPGGNSAVLELSDGSTVNLDEASIGSSVNTGGLIINKLSDGMVSVEIPPQDINGPVEMHTIRTPLGGQYQIKLPDGSNVWLNASSSIRFPTVFSSRSREVELQGEAFFDVVSLKNKQKQPIPFLVHNKDQVIEVLGTQFNVNGYNNETFTRTTLIEGLVRVHVNGSTQIEQLHPGQESNIQNGKIQVQKADMEAVVAWKNGDFIFNNEPLENIMNQIARWYDIEVEYKGADKTRKFSGAVSRNKNLSSVLKAMSYTGKVQFKIKGRRVLVMT